jgi:hypothetical protein
MLHGALVAARNAILGLKDLGLSIPRRRRRRITFSSMYPMIYAHYYWSSSFRLSVFNTEYIRGCHPIISIYLNKDIFPKHEEYSNIQVNTLKTYHASFRYSFYSFFGVFNNGDN